MNQLSHPVIRICGVLLAGAIIFVLDINQPSAWHQLWLPLGLAVAAFAMTQSLMAVAFAACTLSVIHMDFNSGLWANSWGYAAVAGISALIMAILGVQRFRQRIAQTHAARWAHRAAPHEHQE